MKGKETRRHREREEIMSGRFELTYLGYRLDVFEEISEEISWT